MEYKSRNCTPAVQRFLLGDLKSTQYPLVTYKHITLTSPHPTAPLQTLKEGQHPTQLEGVVLWYMLGQQLLTAPSPWYNMVPQFRGYHKYPPPRELQYASSQARLNVGTRRISIKYNVIAHKHTSAEQHSSLRGMPFTLAGLPEAEFLEEIQTKI